MVSIKKPLAFLIVAALMLLTSGCWEKPVTAVGSTAILPLAKVAADQFMQAHPDITVNVSGGGSFTGLSQVASGYVDIGNSDVPAPKDDPVYAGLVEHVVALAPFAIVVHPGVDVDNLTHEQLVGVLTGGFTNWTEVGGTRDQRINLIHRPPSSGSRKVVQEAVLGDRAFKLDAAVMNSNGEVFQTVAVIPGAVGYVDYAYLRKGGVKALKLDGHECTPENVVRGVYPIVAKVRMYTRGEPEGKVKAFIDYVLSPEFQQGFVSEMGFVPVTVDS